MIEHVLQHTLPAAYSLLPPEMGTPAASALLLSIGLQESEFLYRRQVNGPARGFWQFERAGVLGVLQHPHTSETIAHVLRYLRYSDLVDDAPACQALLEHQDTVAACVARLLLWTLPDRLPRADEPDMGYAQYLRAWRPGRRHPENWAANFHEGWARVATP